jgi:hypothetical protein
MYHIATQECHYYNKSMGIYEPATDVVLLDLSRVLNND